MAIASVSNTKAVQILITIAGKSLTVYNDKKNVVSLKISRVIGDAANKFTLELFDETAWELESSLYKVKSAPVTIQYGATGEWSSGKYVSFSGIMTNYNLSFVGAATMLSIEGIVHSSTIPENSSGEEYWFQKANVVWVDTEVKTPDNFDINKAEDRNQCSVDGKWATARNGVNEGYDDGGKSAGGYSDSVCARIDWIRDSEGKYTNWRVLVNPTNIFRRIIRKYNGEIGGTGTGKFIIDESNTDESIWIDSKALTCTQSNETAADFINNNLCKVAWKSGCSSAGFNYFVKNGKHCFKAIDYSSPADNKVVPVGFYMKESNVISFSLETIGAIVMAGSNTDEQGNILVSASSMDYLTSDALTSDYYNLDVDNKASEGEQLVAQEKQERETNWYFAKLSSIKVSSSSSKGQLDTTLSSAFNDLKKLTLSASLVLAGEYNNTYIPGNYIFLTVITPDGRQHYSTGKYFIVSADDSITSDGYTITLKLLKNTDVSQNQTKEPPIQKQRGSGDTVAGQGNALLSGVSGVFGTIGNTPFTSGAFGAGGRYYGRKIGDE